jgi:hypothetical protein
VYRLDNIYRLDYFIVWKNGSDFIFEILDLISENNFEIFHVKKIRISSLRSFLKIVYSHDYAPYFHLKGKLNYLYEIKNDFVYVVSVYNKNPMEFLKINENESHIESKSMNVIKKIIREKYNPRDNNGNLSHNHVIHGTDNQEQAFYFFKKYNIEIPSFESLNRLLPIHLNRFKNFTLKMIDIELLKANIINKDRLETIELINTPHFKFLNNDKIHYQNYLKANLGDKMLRYYSLKKFSLLLKKVKELEEIYPIIISQNMQILDGLHRASILRYLNIKIIPVLLINNE